MKNSNNKKQISKKKLISYIACGSFIGLTAIGSTTGVIVAQQNKEANNIKSLNNNVNSNSVSNHAAVDNSVKNSISNNASVQNISSSSTNFVQKYQNAKTVIDQFIKNTNIDPNSNSFKNGFSSGIEELTNSPQFLKSILKKNKANNDVQDSQITSILSSLKNNYGSTTTTSSAKTTVNKVINNARKTSFANLFSVNYQVRQILNNGITSLSNLSLELSNEKMGLEISSGILAAVLGVLGFCDAGTTVIIATVIGTIMKFACSAIATAIGALNSDVAKMQIEINDASRLLNLSDTLTTINQSIQSCLNAISSSIHKLKDYI
ncbi:hypothetical protein IKS57_02830 [bacterium]|nr:hypothetical protein [bacterium]